jgi:hypothetical protein
MIINDDSRAINKLETSFADDDRVVIYDRHMFIVQATGAYPWGNIGYFTCIDSDNTLTD